jgi:5-hydroxyisourate hydrolase-like protein (transthyretin family)
MPTKYKVQIEPIEEHSERVIEVVTEYLGPGSRPEAVELVDDGGTVIDDLNRDAAAEVKSQLDEAGADARLVSESVSSGELPDVLTGRVRTEESGRPVEGVTVTVRPSETGVDEQLGSATTDSDGIFSIDRFGARVQELFPDARPELRATLVRDGRELRARHGSFDWEAFAAGGYTFEIRVAESETPDGERFTVSGRVTRSSGDPASGLLVRAYDRDLRSEQLLGEATTEEGGRYEIAYASEQFRDAEQGRADLVMRVFNEVGVELEADSNRDGTIFNAERAESVDLQITSSELVEPSEYERLVRAVRPTLNEVPLAALTDDDVEFVASDTGREARRIRFLSQDARLSQEHDLPEGVLYGFARRNVGLVDGETGPRVDLPTLVEEPPDVLREELDAAISNRVVPVELRESLDDVLARLDDLRVEQQAAWPRHELTGHLLEEGTDDPLAGYAVRATDRDARPERRDLGRVDTDEDGRFAFQYRTPPDERDASRTVELTVLSSEGDELVTRERSVRPDQSTDVILHVAVPEPPVPGDDEPIAGLSIGLPEDAVAELADAGVTTLADVRSVEQLTDIEGIGEARADDLRTHADLSILPTDSVTRTALIERGFGSPLEIATTPRENFRRSVEGNVERPDRIYDVAVAAKSTVDSLVTGFRTNRASGLSSGVATLPEDLEITPDISDLCVCRDCESAVSPAAYLANLVQYVLDHVSEDGEKMTLDRVEALFHQPFGDLPVSCDASEEEVRQVRICIGVLLRHLGASRIQFLANPTSQGGAYRKQAYESLLTQLGTSREELRLTQAAGDEERQSLANRLGVAVDHLDQLRFDPSASLGSTGGTPALSEDELEATFGLRAFTYYDDSAASLVIPDSLRNVENPRLLDWRLEHQRHRWTMEDHPEDEFTNERAPRIDPDVIGPDDFRTPNSQHSTAYEMWETRREWVDSRLAELRQQNQTVTIDGNSVDVPDVEAMVGDVMASPVTYTDVQGETRTETPWNRAPTLDEFRTMTQQLEEGTDAEDVRETVRDEFYLTVESLARLVELWEKHEQWTVDRRHPRVTDSEWNEVRSILVQAQKRRFYGWWIWNERDRDVVLGPQTFWHSLREPNRGRWSTVLEASRGEDNPWVDPERVDRDDLPEPTAGETAIGLWEARKATLGEKRDALWKTYRQNGFDAVLSNEVYPQGPPAGYSDWETYFGDRPVEDVHGDLGLEDESVARTLKSVRARVTDTSDGSVPPSTVELDDVFEILTTAWKRTEKYADWYREELSENLTAYWTVRKARLPEWRASRTARTQWQQALNRRSQAPIVEPDLLVPGEDFEEPTAGNPPYDIWDARQKRLDQYLKHLQQIQADATLVSQVNSVGSLSDVSSSLREKLSPYPVRELLENPADHSIAELTDYLSEDVTRLHRLLEDAVGVSLKTLVDLEAREERGSDVDDRLAQLTLTRPAFDFLLDVHSRLAAGVSLSANVWDELYHLLVAVRKKRRYATWQHEERPPYLFDLDPAFSESLDTDALPSDLRSAFQNQNAALSQDVTVTTQDPGDRWLLRDHGNGRTYVVATGEIAYHRGLPEDVLHVFLRTGSISGVRSHGGILLSPERFQLADRQEVLDRFDDDSPERWRTNREVLREWRDTLGARIDEQDRLESTLWEAVGQAESEALPVLREALIRQLEHPRENAALDEKAEWADERFAIDTGADTCVTTTRVAQAMETLQGVVFGIRMGDDLHLPSDTTLAISDEHLEARWQWIGTYEAWRSATSVFLYPQNVLLPTLRREQSPAFESLVEQLQARERPPSADAEDYFQYVRDLFGLHVEVACGVEHEAAGEDLYLFARGTADETGSTRYYWSAVDATAPLANSQGDWNPLPMENVGGDEIQELVGAVQHGSFVYLFAKVWNRSSGQDELKYARMPLDEPSGSVTGPYSVGTPPMDGDSFVAVVKQSRSSDQPPHLVVMPADGPIYDRYVYDQDANPRWRETQQRADDANPTTDEWRVIDSGHSGVISSEDSFQSLEAVVELTPATPEEMGEFYLVTTSGGQLHYRLFGKWDDGQFRTLRPRPHTDGAFLWPETNKLFEVSGDSAQVVERNASFARQQQYKDHTYVDVLNTWLRQTLRLDLKNVPYNDTKSYYDLLSQTGGDVDKYAAVEKLLEDHPEWRVADRLISRGLVSGPHGTFDGLANAVSMASKDMVFKLRAISETSRTDTPWNESGRLFVGRTLIQKGQSEHLAYAQSNDSPSPVKIGSLYDQAQRSSNRLFASLKADDTVDVGELSVPDAVTEQTVAHWQENAEHVWETNTAGQLNRISTRTLRRTLEEAFYFVPVQIGLDLRRMGRYLDALEWFRLVYDYQAEPGQRKNVFLREQSGADGFQRDADWLVDPIGPHEIAQTRDDAYRQFTLFSLVRCLIQYGDDEFTRDTPESIARARRLYQNALNLLEDELGPMQHPCTELTVEVKEEVLERVGDGDGFQSDGVARRLARAVDRIDVERELRELHEAIREIGSDEGSRSERIKRVSNAISSVSADGATATTLAQSLSRQHSAEETAYRTLLSDTDLARSTARVARESTSLAASADGTTNGTYRTAERTVSLPFCVPPNPVLESLRQHASQNLSKIRNCQNIAGMRRELASYSAPTDTTVEVPAGSSGLPFASAGRSHRRPTQYRYDTLITRSKELVNLAQQFESRLLRLFEKRDQAEFRQLKAEQRGEIARARVNLQDQRIDKAEERVELAALQRERAQTRVGTYRQWLAAGLNKWEQQMIESYRNASQARQDAGGLNWFSSTTQTLAMASTGGPATVAAGLVGAGMNLGATAARSAATEAQTRAQIASVRASHARRKQRWEFREDLARQDVRISSQQMDIAREQVDIVREERRIAQLQSEHANEISEFLANKFTSRELYEWMLEIIEEVNRTFLQQATAMAKLAEQQLAFERHERPQQIVESNYWEAPTEGGVQADVGQADGEQDRHGLTGSARLLQDIYQLDQYEFRTDERKQQVRKTISLSQLAPFELQQFRETGVLSFDTDRELFERDHPDHYLRLIKNVRVSIIALTPPTDRIKAKLRNDGISRVVTGGPPFENRVIRRNPDSITLSSPQNETGIFQLTPEGEKLNPFENTGVDTSWQLRMPKAANAFDYSTIADVLLTINYTALESPAYRQQVLERLDLEETGQRAFSFSQEFADQWYDLHNPAQTDDPMTVSYETRRVDFPPNLTDVEIEDVILYFVTDEGADVADIEVRLEYVPDDGQGTVGGTATPVEQRISTRRGNGSSWTSILGNPVSGEWMLSLPDTATMKRLFDDERIEDMLFVVTYEGRTPDWPA